MSDTFVICGVLYAVDDIDERDTRIRFGQSLIFFGRMNFIVNSLRFGLDLYKNKLLDIELPFTNPFSLTTMLTYNARLQSLMTWDGGNQLTYPIKYHAMGIKDMPEEKVNSTGYSLQTVPETGLQVDEVQLD